MVARLTPDQKVACSIHVGFNIPEAEIPRAPFSGIFFVCGNRNPNLFVSSLFGSAIVSVASRIRFLCSMRRGA